MALLAMESCDGLPTDATAFCQMFPSSVVVAQNTYTGGLIGAPGMGRFGGGAISLFGSNSNYAEMVFKVAQKATLYVGFWMCLLNSAPSSASFVRFKLGKVRCFVATLNPSVNTYPSQPGKPGMFGAATAANGYGSPASQTTDSWTNIGAMYKPGGNWAWVEVGINVGSSGWLKVSMNGVSIINYSGDTRYSTTGAGTTVNGSPYVNNLSYSTMSNIDVGMTVTGTGIPANTTITAINGYRVTLNNNATSSATNTFTFTANVVDGVAISFNETSGNPAYIDDIFIWDSTGSTPFNGLQTSPLYIETLTPAADGTSGFGTQSPSQSAGSHYLNVAEFQLEDDDTTYIEDSTTTHLDNFSLTWPVSYGDVYCVQLSAFAKNSDGSARSMYLTATQAATTLSSGLLSLTPQSSLSITATESSFSYYIQSMSVSPSAIPNGALLSNASTRMGSSYPTQKLETSYYSNLSQSADTITNGSPVVTSMTATSGIGIGSPISGSYIPSNTYVLSVDSSSQVTMSANATNSASFALSVYQEGVYLNNYPVSTQTAQTYTFQWGYYYMKQVYIMTTNCAGSAWSYTDFGNLMVGVEVA